MNETHNGSTILLVDDDSLEVIILQRVLRDLSLASRLTHVADGEQALAHLRSEERQTPHAILLDLNMPRMTGLELLDVLKTDNGLRHIPVIVTTTSQRQEDMTTSFALGAAAYVVKSSDYVEYRENIKAVGRFLEPHASQDLLPVAGTPASRGHGNGTGLNQVA